MKQYRCDVVIVGSGAGGSACARAVAEAGLDTIVLEMGSRQTPETFTQKEEEMIPKLFQQAGSRTNTDKTIAILQGKGVGGSTLHNLNLCKRISPTLLDRWAETQALPDLPTRLTEAYKVIEKDLNVTRVTEARVNRHNDLFRKGCQALEFEHATLHHNRVGCVGAGFCELGCAYDAKQNAAKVLLPQAEHAGARILPQHRVTRIHSRWGRTTGVSGLLTQPGQSPQHFRVHASLVVMAASATGSSALLLASGLGNRHTGRGLHIHPAATVGADFADPVYGWKGVPQSVECTEFLDPVDADRRTWILPVFAHPAGTAGLMPGVGGDLMRQMLRYPHMAAASAMLHDHGSGSITTTRDGQPRIHYRLDPRDGQALVHGMVETAKIWLAAGATEVMIPFAHPVYLQSTEQAERLRQHTPRPLDPTLMAVHPMGSLAMAGTAEKGACGPWGQVWGTQGLYAADGSLFPSSTGGPPQLTIYAIGHMVGTHIGLEFGHPKQLPA